MKVWLGLSYPLGATWDGAGVNDQPRRRLLAFTQALIRLFHQHPVLRRRQFFQGRSIRGSEVKDLAWFRPDGREMADEDWNNPYLRCLGLRLAGDAIEEVDARGSRIIDDSLLILLNAHHEPISFVLPAHRPRVRWEPILDTREATGQPQHRPRRGGEAYELEARSVALLRLRRESAVATSQRHTRRRNPTSQDRPPTHPVPSREEGQGA